MEGRVFPKRVNFIPPNHSQKDQFPLPLGHLRQSLTVSDAPPHYGKWASGSSHQQTCPVNANLPELIQGENSSFTEIISEVLGAYGICSHSYRFI